MRRRTVWTSLLAVSVVSAVLPAVAGSVNPSIEAVNSGLYSHYWSPTQASVTAGGVVTFANHTTIPHGVQWTSVAKPTCEAGVPVGTTAAASGTEWSGNCTFAQAGTYTFYCTVHGAEMSGTITVTQPGAPAVVTGAASGVSETEATLKGTVNPEGKATEYFFDYGLTAAYGTKTALQSAGAGSSAAPASAVLSGLAPGTTYHFQLVAENEHGTTHGADQTFTTPSPPGPPSAITGEASSIGETAATLTGTVNPDGRSTEYRFEYGLTGEYGASTPPGTLGEDHANHSVSAPLSGLAAGTVYHYRLVAESALGTVFGAEHTFTTSAPSVEEPHTTPAGGGSTPPSTIVPASIITQPETPPVQQGSPLASGASRAVRVLAGPHGSVRGSVAVSGFGAGGRLQVDLFASGASLALHGHARQVSVGRFVRNGVAAGNVSFKVAPSASVRRALRRHRRLTLTVRVAITPRGGHATVVTRRVVLQA